MHNLTRKIKSFPKSAGFILHTHVEAQREYLEGDWMYYHI